MKSVQAEDVGMIEVIIEEIRQAAEEEIKRILEEAEKEAKRIVEEAKQRAQELREEKIRQLIYEHRARIEREYAPKRLDIKRRYIKEKYEKILNFFNEAVSEVVEEIKNDMGKYGQFLRKSVEKSFLNIRSNEIILHPCKGESGILKDVLKSMSDTLMRYGKSYKIGDEIECDGGVFIESEDGHEYYNATIKAKVAEIRDSLFPSLAEKLLAGF